MSHDRGCWKCGRDYWEYEDCDNNDCAKFSLRSIKENAAVSKTADDSSNLSEDTKLKTRIDTKIIGMEVKTDPSSSIEYLYMRFEFTDKETGITYQGQVRNNLYQVSEMLKTKKPDVWDDWDLKERTVIDFYTETP